MTRDDVEVKIIAKDSASSTLKDVGKEADKLDGKTSRIKIEAEGLDDLANKLSSLGGPFAGMGSALGAFSGKAGIAGGVVAIGAGLAAAADHAADLAIEADNLAGLTGDSVEEASRLNAVWKSTGADTKDLQDVLLQMNGVLATDAELARRLGVNLNDGATIGERFKEVAAALDDIDNAAERSQIASRAFGEEGVRQFNAMQRAVGDLETALDKVPDGLVFDAANVEQARDTKSQLAEVKLEAESLASTLGGAVLPVVNGVLKGTNYVAGEVGKVVNSMGRLFGAGGNVDELEAFSAGWESAQSSIGRARQQLAEQNRVAIEATQYVTELKAQTDGLADSTGNYAAVQKILTEATKEANEAAEHRLDLLRDERDAAVDAIDKVNDLARADLAVDSASRGLADAQADLNQLLTEGTVSAERKAAALQNIADAQADLDDATADLSETIAEHDRLMQSSIATDEDKARALRDVEAAERALAAAERARNDALDAVPDTERELKRAREDLADARTDLLDFSPQIATLDNPSGISPQEAIRRRRDLTRAVEDAESRVERAIRRVEDANRDIADAQDDVFDAAEAVNTAVADQTQLMTKGKVTDDQRQRSLNMVRDAQARVDAATLAVNVATTENERLLRESIPTDAEKAAAVAAVKQAQIDLADTLIARAQTFVDSKGLVDDTTLALAAQREELKRLAEEYPAAADAIGAAISAINSAPGLSPPSEKFGPTIPTGLSGPGANMVVQIDGKTLFRMMWDETERQTRNGWRPGPGVLRVLRS